ncbi:MAG: O-antigen ligase family protein [Cohaesibacter sp.]|nr:O-antigen ligase family protein [Cohaesibacter sp.]
MVVTTKMHDEARPHGKNKSGTHIRRAGQWGIYSALILGLLMFGAVHDLPKLLVAFVITITLMIASWAPIKRGSLNHLAKQSWILLGILVAYVLLQSWFFAGNPLAHSIWQTAGELIYFEGGAISVEPSLSRWGLFSLIPPFLLFIAILHAFQGDDEAWKLMSFLGGLSLVFILYGIIQARIFPDHILIRELERPDRSFHGTLINRNNAATLVALSSLIFLALIIHKAKGIPLLKFPKAVFFPSRLPVKRRAPLIIWSLGLFLSFIALFMTQSRGGLGATVIAWGGLLPPLLARALSQSSQGQTGFLTERDFKLRRVLFFILVSIVAVGFISIYAEGTLFRIADTNTEVGRFCNFPSMWQAVLDNWLFGSGFGTFEAIFPLYRNPECGVWGIWTQAHNFWLEGLMGFGIFFLAFAGYALWQLAQCYRSGIKTRRSLRFVSHIGLSALILIFLHGLVEFSLQIPGVALYASALLACLCVLSMQRLSWKR